MKHLLAILGAVIAAIAVAATGAYVLWQFHSTTGLVVGVGLILLGVAIALPIQLRSGTTTFKDSVVVVVEQAEDALKGGTRKPPEGS